MRAEPDVALRLRKPDGFLKNENAGAVPDVVRVQGHLEEATLLLCDIQLAA